nr:hypothetical protein CFP56_60281 [Quercus suber]
MAIADEARRLPEHNIQPGGGTSTAVSSRGLVGSILKTLKPDLFSGRKTSAQRPGPTAWLDGLRGCAALSVCIMHLLVYTHQNMELCHGPDSPTYLNLPIIRVFFMGGHFAVMIFFTISGYVLPRRLISLLHEGRKEDFVEALNSAVVRRPGRLFIPVILSTLTLAFVWHIFSIPTNFPEHQSNIFLELMTWWKDMMKFLFFFRGGHFLFTYYNGHSWTIPIELKGSMFMFVWLFMLHQCRTRSRILLTFGMIIYLACGAAGAWYAAFFAGMFTSELELLASSKLKVSLPWDNLIDTLKSQSAIRYPLLHVMLLCGLFLASQPVSDYQDMEKTLGNCPGFSTLMHFIPFSYMEYELDWRWFWLFWAAWLVLVAVKELPWLRSLFETSPAQYLGRHSFALYLIHGPTIALLADRLFFMTGIKTPQPFDPSQGPCKGETCFADFYYNLWPLPNTGPLGLEINFIVPALISLTAMLYIAEVGTRVFDEPAVKVSKWMWQRIKMSG